MKRPKQILLGLAACGLALLTTTPAFAVNYPHNAAEVKAQNPGAPDGEYTIDPDGPGGNPPFSVYCNNMAGTPTEYLTLARVGEGTNFSKFATGGSRGGTDVYTHWSKLRIIPETLQVDKFDLSFAVSRGLAWYPAGPTNSSSSIYSHWSYANAYDCISLGSSQGRANVDLTGTPFRVDPTVQFIVAGYAPAGSANISSDRKVVNLQGGGYCGCDSTGVDSVTTSITNIFMRLSFDPSLVTPAIAPTIDTSGQPQSQQPSAGGMATFAVTAIGTLPVTYHWRFNGVNIANATNASYTISPANVSNLGLYDVVVANSAGTNTSSVASLSLLDLKMLPTLYLSATNGSKYRIDGTPTLGPTNWTTLTNVTITTQPFIYVDFTATNNNQKFYRAVPQ